ncbi:hypothetical protein SAMN02745181_3342 [Rubritalea squalenifaciens DSM 18772]|uniref:Uncharacterized protein n=1 Tax=Rubritalea squalenifaciens DSM 18772 TaxID=1123071 RepID=A0A1M6PYE9_9BACT|nr:hypothetical protein [Rubritalea squalenifaciens]SHK12942.1 hypothetical protein SAMN02745181_3342 [Rubritalea squalenifaciens DSM 18772]
MNSNGMTPYQAPEAAGSSDLTANEVPSEQPKVFGIIHIVYSVLGGLKSLAFLGVYFAMGALMGQMKEGLKEEGIDFEVFKQIWDIMGRWMLIEGVVCLVLGIILFIAGIGLLKRKMWGRNLSIVWAASRIVLLIASLVVMLPHQNELQELSQQMNGQEVSGMGGMQQSMGNLPSIIMVLAYPVVTLIFMFGSTMKNALRKG